MKGSIGIFYQLTVKDKNGKVVRKTRLRRSKSFCIAFLKMLQVQNAILGVPLNIKDTLGADEACDPFDTMFKTLQAAGSATLGLLLGTGTTAVDNLDYVMETQIAHGNAATQLEYGGMTEVGATEVGANVDYQLLRSCLNNSGDTIQVTEAGVYGMIKAAKTALMIHDVFTAVPVLNTETITATYTIRTTV
ncbi:hypothetical protein ES705_23190 [subsurface metagenome]